MNGISAFIKENPKRSLTLFHHVRIKEKSADPKRAICRPHWHPNLRLPACKAVRNKFLVFTIYLVSSILLQQPKWTKTMTKCFRNIFFLFATILINSQQKQVALDRCNPVDNHISHSFAHVSYSTTYKPHYNIQWQLKCSTQNKRKTPTSNGVCINHID